MVFVDLFAGGAGSTTAALTLDTVADESRKKMADGVARSPSRLCSRDRKICCYGDALSTILLLACFCALLPTFVLAFDCANRMYLSFRHTLLQVTYVRIHYSGTSFFFVAPPNSYKWKTEAEGRKSTSIQTQARSCVWRRIRA